MSFIWMETFWATWFFRLYVIILSYLLTHSLTSIYSRRYLLVLHCFCSLSSLVVNCSHIQDASSLFIFGKILFLLQFLFKPSGCVICIPLCMVVYKYGTIYLKRVSFPLQQLIFFWPTIVQKSQGSISHYKFDTCVIC